MAEPILEQIAASIRARAAFVTRANGYHVDTESVLRKVRRENETSVHMRAVLEQGERSAPESGVQSCSTWIVPFALHCLVRPGDEDKTPVDTYINRWAADLETVFAEGNDHPWWVAGVFNHYLRGPQPLPETDEYAGCDGFTLIIDVHYRHRVGDPYTAA